MKFSKYFCALLNEQLSQIGQTERRDPINNEYFKLAHVSQLKATRPPYTTRIKTKTTTTTSTTSTTTKEKIDLLFTKKEKAVSLLFITQNGPEQQKTKNNAESTSMATEKHSSLANI
jgi:hypothetical protein